MGDGLGLPTDIVFVLRVLGDVLLAGGKFAQSGTSYGINGIARWTGTVWERIGPGTTGTVFDITPDIFTANARRH